MPRESEKKEAEFKAGIFIITVLILLIFSILWLRYFAIKPEMTIIAKFSDPGPVSTGLQVYYQGVSIGEVAKIKFSDNFKYTLVHLDIYEKNLKIPKNVYAQVRQEGITGQKYVNIKYSGNSDHEYLLDSDVITGKTPFGLEEIQAFFEEQVKSGKLEKILNELEQTLANANETSKKIDKMASITANLLERNKHEIDSFFKQGSKAAANLNQITKNINNITGNPKTKKEIEATLTATASAAENLNDILGDPEFKKSIKSTFEGMEKVLGKTEKLMDGLNLNTTGTPSGFSDTLGSVNLLLKDIDTLVNNINCYTGDIYKDVKQTNLIPNTSKAFGKANDVLDKTDNILGKVGETEFDSDTKSLIIKTIENTNQALESHKQAAKQIDCLSQGLSEMLSKRFLLLKLLFGKPGDSLEECESLQDCSKKLNDNKIILPCPLQKQSNRSSQ